MGQPVDTPATGLERARRPARQRGTAMPAASPSTTTERPSAIYADPWNAGRGMLLNAWGFAAVTFDKVLDDEFGGNVAFREIDLGLLAVEFPLSE